MSLIRKTYMPSGGWRGAGGGKEGGEGFDSGANLYLTGTNLALFRWLDKDRIDIARSR